jgi:hypothetical protein
MKKKFTYFCIGVFMALVSIMLQEAYVCMRTWQSLSDRDKRELVDIVSCIGGVRG